jgi:uridine phosphorylase
MGRKLRRQFRISSPPVPALRPSAPIATDAILVGDPGRALMLAQELLTRPKMSNHARGLWGYTGRTPQGRALTVQSTGIGGPSAATVLADLAGLGLQRAVRVGTCVALDSGLALAEILVVEGAVAADSLGSLVRSGDRAAPDADLLGALAREQRGRRAAVESGHLSRALLATTSGAGADAHDLQTAYLLAVAAHLGVAAAALLIVAETAAGERIGDEALEEAAKRAGRDAATALST